MVDIKIKAYRIKGGAIVRVFRNGKERKYKVGLKRFASLKWLFSVWVGVSGWHGGSSLDLIMQSPTGYRDALCWLSQHGTVEAKKAISA